MKELKEMVKKNNIKDKLLINFNKALRDEEFKSFVDLLGLSYEELSKYTSILEESKCEYVNFRALSSQKIDIHGAISIFVNVKKRKCTEVISEYDEPTIELKRATAPAISPIGCNEKYIVLEDEFEAGPAQPSIRSIIRYDAQTNIKETKLITISGLASFTIYIDS